MNAIVKCYAFIWWGAADSIRNYEFEITDLGIGKLGNMGIWECGNVEMWECGNWGIWKCQPATAKLFNFLIYKQKKIAVRINIRAPHPTSTLGTHNFKYSRHF
jgi:hypothetical protein